MFPPYGSTIIRNGDGEVLGWDAPSYDDQEYCDVCGGMHSAFACDAYDEDDED